MQQSECEKQVLIFSASLLDIKSLVISPSLLLATPSPKGGRPSYLKTGYWLLVIQVYKNKLRPCLRHLLKECCTQALRIDDCFLGFEVWRLAIGA